VLAHVLGGQGALAALARDGHRSVAVDAGDGPGVAVGDLDVGVVAAGDDPVTGTDACSLAGGGARVIDSSGCDQLRTDGAVERGDLLVGVGDDDHRDACLVGQGGVPGERADAIGVGGVEVDLSSGEQRVEHGGGVVAGPHGQAQPRVVLVRHREGDAVRRHDSAGEAMHRIEFAVGFWVRVADGQVEHSPRPTAGSWCRSPTKATRVWRSSATISSARAVSWSSMPASSMSSTSVAVSTASARGPA
jgi:hypothetical protein